MTSLPASGGMSMNSAKIPSSIPSPSRSTPLKVDSIPMLIPCGSFIPKVPGQLGGHTSRSAVPLAILHSSSWQAMTAMSPDCEVTCISHSVPGIGFTVGQPEIVMQRGKIVSLVLFVSAGLPLAMGISEALGQSSVAVVPGDNRAVKFFGPGAFEEAQRTAKEQRRCLLIKGVAGGMDARGAIQSTKGHW